MKVLIKGSQSEKRLNLLLQLTQIESEPLIESLKMHLVNGWAAGISARTNGIDPGNFSEAISRLENRAQIVEQIKELDCAHLLVN